MTKLFNKFKKSCFWTIFDPFSQFLRQKKCFRKIRLSDTTSYRLLAPCQNLEKTNDTIPRKRLDRFKGCVRYILLVCFVCLKESTCETKKNVFYFTSKALFILVIIKF